MKAVPATILLSIAALSSQCATGEPRTSRLLVIRGRVSDSTTSAPVAAAVSLLDHEGGVMAAANGEFELRLNRPPTAEVTLLVRRIGYEPRRISIGNTADTLMDVGTIRLKQARAQIDDMIVTDTARHP